MFIKLTVVVVLANRTQLPNVGSCIRKDVTDDDNINDDDDVEGNILYCNCHYAMHVIGPKKCSVRIFVEVTAVI